MPERIVKEHELIEATKRLERCITEKMKRIRDKLKVSERPLKVGDEVQVLQVMDKKGHLLKKYQTMNGLFKLGILKMKIRESGLEYVKPEKEKQTVSRLSIRGTSSHVKLGA